MTKTKAEIASQSKLAFNIKEIKRYNTQVVEAIKNKNLKLIEKLKSELISLVSDLKNSYMILMIYMIHLLKLRIL